MNLPKIDLSALPDLDTLTGLFGSLANSARVGGFDDYTIIAMVVVYDHLTP